MKWNFLNSKFFEFGQIEKHNLFFYSKQKAKIHFIDVRDFGYLGVCWDWDQI